MADDVQLLDRPVDDLTALAHRRLAEVVDTPPTTLDEVLRRLLDRDDRLTYSAFGSAL